MVVRSPQSADLLAQQEAFTLDAEIGPFKVFRLRENPRLVELAGLAHPVDKTNWLERAFQDFILPPVNSTVNPELANRAAGARVDIIDFGDEYLKFRTNRPGEPHLIKITYHPGWYSRSGEDIHLADPAFMSLTPDSELVEIAFGTTPGQRLGRYFSLAGLLALLIPVFSLPGTRQRLSIRGIAATVVILSGLAGLAIFNHPSRHYQVGHEYFQRGKFALAARARALLRTQV